MAEFVGTAVIFTIVGVLIGLAWKSDGEAIISQLKDFEDAVRKSERERGQR